MHYEDRCKIKQLEAENAAFKAGIPKAEEMTRKLVEEMEKLKAQLAKKDAEIARLKAPESPELVRIICEAVRVDGDHHKQWFLEEIAKLLHIDLPEHDKGIAP
jgi:SMC interacting uncharacterized protein involved in chromosome segregation